MFMLDFLSNSSKEMSPPPVIHTCNHSVHRGSKVSPNNVAELRALRTKEQFHCRKLHLVLDLDHTLVHSQLTVSVEGKDLLEMKLRPCADVFLEQADTMFEMYLYTMGNRGYAEQAAKVLDPQSKYFGCRIISCDESPGLKSLDHVLGEESAVVIVDDSETAWEPRNLDNLIQVKGYHYWEAEVDETEGDSPLMRTLHLLRQIHVAVFNEKAGGRDVRVVLKGLQGKLL